MSSRILQQDNSLLLTQASEPIVNENFIAANSIETSSPTIPTASISQTHNVTAVSVQTSSPVVQTPSVTQSHSISVTAVVSGQVFVSNSAITQSHALSTTSITSGQVVVSSSAITQSHELSTPSITSGQVVIANSAITQSHTLSTPSITSGQVFVSNSAITQAHNVDTDDISSGQTVVSNTQLTQDHDLQAVSILTGTPVVPSISAIEEEKFSTGNILAGIPALGSSSLTQDHSLSPENILTPKPDLGEPVDPNAIVAKEIKEIEQMFGGWQRRTYEVPDGRLVQAEREIQASTGDLVSIDRKAKSLIKFGRSAELGTSALETVWTVGGDETYVASNTISHISSSSSSDTEEVYVEGHTLENGEFTFLSQTVTLSGQNKVALDTSIARVSRISNNGGTELVGRVAVYEDTTVSNGIPSDDSKIHIDIVAGFQQSFKAATTFSKEDYYVMTGFYGAVSAKKSSAVDFYIEIREPNGVFLPKACFTASSTGGNSDISLDPAIIVPKNSDIRVRCDTETNQAVVFGIFKGYLAKVL